jgi:hypothetical protein
MILGLGYTDFGESGEIFMVNWSLSAGSSKMLAWLGEGEENMAIQKCSLGVRVAHMWFHLKMIERTLLRALAAMVACTPADLPHPPTLAFYWFAPPSHLASCSRFKSSWLASCPFTPHTRRTRWVLNGHMKPDVFGCGCELSPMGVDIGAIFHPNLFCHGLSFWPTGPETGPLPSLYGA